MRRPHRLKGKFAALSVILFVSMVLASEHSCAEVVLGLEPGLALRLLYPKLKGHKAMAIGPGGIWEFVDRQSSSDRAKKSALKRCDAYVTQERWLKYGKCEVVAVDDEVIWTKPPIAQPLDVPLPLPDRPLIKAKLFQPDRGPPKGIILALHGSENAYRVSSGPHPFQKSWFQYFNSIGMLVVYPSSFDDVFPTYEYSGWISPEDYPRATKMAMMRVAQAKRTISQLRRSYPELPIFLWSHSAGGIITQSIGEGIKGAVIVGTSCGVGSPGLNAIPKDVPVLYVFGSRDEYVIRGKKRLTKTALKTVCGPEYGGETRQIVIADGDDHSATIWHQNVLNAVASFFGQNPFSLAERKTEFKISDDAKKAFEKRYTYSPVKKAFAIGKDGHAWSESLPTQEQANVTALLQCNRSSTGFSYPPSGRHECAIYALGNTVILKP